MRVSKLEIGALVQWSQHKHWDCKGLGFVVDTQPNGAKVIWYQDIIHGHAKTGTWYEYEEDFSQSGDIEIV